MFRESSPQIVQIDCRKSIRDTHDDWLEIIKLQEENKYLQKILGHKENNIQNQNKLLDGLYKEIHGLWYNYNLVANSALDIIKTQEEKKIKYYKISLKKYMIHIKLHNEQ